jgi:hypothetical protein
MLRLSSRLVLPGMAMLFAFAAPAQAAPPVVTLSAPSGHSVANPPSFAGTASRNPGDSVELTVEIFKGGLDGDIAGDAADPIQRTSALVREDGTFSGTFAEALADGTYTARARQYSGEQGPGLSNALVFTIGEVVVTPAPEATATPVPQAAAPTATATATATPTPAPAVALPATPYVCKSRRDFTKHVRRPDGTRLKVVATVEGRVLTSILRGHDILVRVNLRGLPKDTYNLHVAITRTRRDGRRVTTDSVTQVRYRTCVPQGRG